MAKIDQGRRRAVGLKWYQLDRDHKVFGVSAALDRELRPKGIKVGVICPGGVKTEFALGKGRPAESVAQSAMLEPEDVAAAVVLARTQAPGSRIIEIQMRPMSEPLA